jgi:hypothetical protein
VSAGLPGAGLAGVFFILSAILAVPIELVRTARGRSSRQAWLRVGRNVGLALAMLMALELAFAAVSALAAEVSGERVLPPVLPHVPVLLTLAVLVTVLATTKALELALRSRRLREEPVEVPEPLLPPPHSIRSVESRGPTAQHTRPTSAHARAGKQEEAGVTALNGGLE